MYCNKYTMQATAPSAEKKSSSCQVSVCFKTCKSTFFWSQWPHWEKKIVSIDFKWIFLLPFAFKLQNWGKRTKMDFFFCIKKEHFSMYLYVKQCAIENEVNSRNRCCMFANNSKLHMHYLTLEPNSLKNRIFGIYIYFFIIFWYKLR